MTSAGNKDMGGPEDLGASAQVPRPLVAGHTPGPWRVEEGTTVIWSDNSYDEGTGCVGCIVARAAKPPSWKASRPTADEQEANAAFIVLACNSFHDMKEALEKINALEVGCGDGAVGDYIEEIREIARAAFVPEIRALAPKGTP